MFAATIYVYLALSKKTCIRKNKLSTETYLLNTINQALDLTLSSQL